jgi:hypothetical protein
VHSHYSFLDGASSPETLARRAAELGQDTLALTDWSGVYGAVEFDHACRRAGIRPLHGAEIALTDGRHLTLLVKNNEGWRSLCRLLTAAQLAGHKGHAPVTPDLLAAHTSGLLCLTGCRHGALAAPLLAGAEATAWRTARWLRKLYGDDLWVELPRNDHPDDRLLTHRLAYLADRLSLGIVATANVHYAVPAEGPLADVLACIKTGTTLEAARQLRPNHCYHLADAGEMAARFADLPAAITNTTLVASRCVFALDFGRHVFPALSMPPRPDGGVPTPDEQLRALCNAGLTTRYAAGDLALWRQAVAQLDHELAVIAHLGLVGYFLVVHDVVRFACERGIPCQGRGSAAGSVVAYTLGISRVEPLTNRLLFERFLSAERGSLPDIDIDFGHARREEVIQYLYHTYGAAHVGMACTVQTYHHKGAVRDVGKALGIPPPTLAAITRRVRQRLDETLAQAVAAAVGAAALASPLWQHFIALSEQLVGTPRHLGIHNGYLDTVFVSHCLDASGARCIVVCGERGGASGPSASGGGQSAGCRPVGHIGGRVVRAHLPDAARACSGSGAYGDPPSPPRVAGTRRKRPRPSGAARSSSFSRASACTRCASVFSPARNSCTSRWCCCRSAASSRLRAAFSSRTVRAGSSAARRSSTRCRNSASTSAARLAVARETPASRARVVTSSSPSLRSGAPASRRSIAARRAACFSSLTFIRLPPDGGDDRVHPCDLIRQRCLL